MTLNKQTNNHEKSVKSWRNEASQPSTVMSGSSFPLSLRCYQQCRRFPFRRKNFSFLPKRENFSFSFVSGKPERKHSSTLAAIVSRPLVASTPRKHTAIVLHSVSRGSEFSAPSSSSSVALEFAFSSLRFLVVRRVAHSLSGERAMK